MKPPIKIPTLIKPTTTKSTLSTSNKYFLTPDPNNTKYYSKTTLLIQKIKQAATNKIHKLLKYKKKQSKQTSTLVHTNLQNTLRSSPNINH